MSFHSTKVLRSFRYARSVARNELLAWAAPVCSVRVRAGLGGEGGVGSRFARLRHVGGPQTLTNQVPRTIHHLRHVDRPHDAEVADESAQLFVVDFAVLVLVDLLAHRVELVVGGNVNLQPLQ